MSAGEAMLIVFIGIFGFLVVAFALLLAVMLLDALAEALGRAGIEATVADLVSAVIVGLLVAFFIWFVFCFPRLDYMPTYGEPDYYQQPIEMRD